MTGEWKGEAVRFLPIMWHPYVSLYLGFEPIQQGTGPFQVRVRDWVKGRVSGVRALGLGLKLRLISG